MSQLGAGGAAGDQYNDNFEDMRSQRPIDGQEDMGS
jgi:hypothetical protein